MKGRSLERPFFLDSKPAARRTLTLTRLRGFQDLYGAHAAMFTRVEECARRIMTSYAVGEIRLPLLERVELYQRSTGETSDVVEKQMYAFADRDEAETMIALR